jgi:Protein of unknown function (DUF1194)
MSDGRAVAFITIISAASSTCVWHSSAASIARIRITFPMARLLLKLVITSAAFAAAMGPLSSVSLSQQVGIELVLALDSSASMNRKEFAVQIQGIATAFKDPAVLQAVTDLAPLGVAIAVTQWGGPGESRVVVPFTRITTPRQAKAFGFRVGRVTRSFYAATTSIVTGMEHSVTLLDTNDFEGQRKVIDISGDGEDNSGLDLKAARASAKASGITVNGLAIESEQPGLFEYYRQNVITGAESFAVKATDFDDYARAIREKLLRELRPLGS